MAQQCHSRSLFSHGVMDIVMSLVCLPNIYVCLVGSSNPIEPSNFLVDLFLAFRIA